MGIHWISLFPIVSILLNHTELPVYKEYPTGIPLKPVGQHEKENP